MEKNLNILVVDDEEPMREVCFEVLNAAGYRVSVASGGWEALGLLDKKWDLILSDYNMPGLNGAEFFKSAERRAPGISDRFLFMTGDRASAAIIEGMNCRLIKKPFRVKDLLEEVETALRDSEAKRKDKRIRLDGCHLHITIGGAELDAFAEDLSLNGMKIRYSGGPMEAGPGLNVSIEGLDVSRDARVVWSSGSAANESFSGIIFEKPVPMSVISVLMPGSI